MLELVFCPRPKFRNFGDVGPCVRRFFQDIALLRDATRLRNIAATASGHALDILGNVRALAGNFEDTGMSHGQPLGAAGHCINVITKVARRRPATRVSNTTAGGIPTGRRPLAGRGRCAVSARGRALARGHRRLSV